MTTLDSYITLGRSGLRVSPLTLGTMTFGEDWDWGASPEASEAILASSTPPTSTPTGTPKRLSATSSPGGPAGATLRALDDLVTAGQVRYVGLSDVPSWVAAQAQTIARFRGWTPVTALQLEYSLLERTPDGELLPMAEALGIGVLPRSPLRGGPRRGRARQRSRSRGYAAAPRSPPRSSELAPSNSCGQISPRWRSPSPPSSSRPSTSRRRRPSTSPPPSPPRSLQCSAFRTS
jgi:aryl-alcohol dehydrogenase-like predicted oxidoreductase